MECPFCGAEEIQSDIFNCWTKVIGVEPYYHRGMFCYERQIAQLQERLAEKVAEADELERLWQEKCEESFNLKVKSDLLEMKLVGTLADQGRRVR